MKSISILIPTYNSSKVLPECLASIAMQTYPKTALEIIIADAGSADDTLEVASKYTGKIYPNPLKTGEAGKAVALKYATGEIVALIDSDNVLPSPDWLTRMVAPFDDPEIVGTEPLDYTYRRQDGYITRYSALMGMNDPLCLFLGNYDRFNILTGKWTEMPVKVEDQGMYLKVTLDSKKLPTIGANGFLLRREELLKCSVRDYLFDIDVVYELTSQGRSTYAKVKTGIVHIFSGSLVTFTRKQRRRIQDYLYYRQLRLRQYPWKSMERRRLLKFIAYSTLVLPLLTQGLKGYWRRPDPAWLFHPVACWITLGVYGIGILKADLFGVAPRSREGWRQ